MIDNLHKRGANAAIAYNSKGGNSSIYDVENVDIENISKQSLSNDAVDCTTDDGKDSEKKNSAFVVIALSVLLWYSAAVVAITTTKKIMLLAKLPFMLCTSQFAIAAILTSLYTFCINIANVNSSGQSEYVTGSSSSSHKDHSNKLITNEVRKIAISYTLGFVFTNISFSVVNANFTETVKAGEPISSVIMGYFYLNERSSFITYLTLIPICLGVGISSYDDVSFNAVGFLAAAVSNICFSSRAVFAKHLFHLFPDCLSETTLFKHISVIGLVILVPLMILFERSDLWTTFLDNEMTNLAQKYELLYLLILNGVAYTLYNITSFAVLNKTSIATHAVLNLLRRVVIVGCTTCYFGINLSSLNLFGVSVAVFGVSLYVLSKNMHVMQYFLKRK